MTATLSLLPGTVVGGHYVVGALINRGGFGAVYRGFDTSEGNRPCAIKETYDVTPAARRHALMEVGVLFTITSDHLPQVYDAFENNGRFYLVMQLIEGQNLLEIMQQRGAPCSEQEMLRWLLPITDVLYELHSRHPAVMHRDIKPGNIIITPDQTAVLVDFGLTKLYDPNADTQTNVRAVSEGFSPIEQYLGKTSPQSDIYSLAATMYYLLTCHVPPPSVQRSMHDTLVPPSQFNPLISPHVERALLTGLALNAEQRFASMHDFNLALQPWQSAQQPLRLGQPSLPSFNGYADRTMLGTRVDAGSLAGSTSAQAGQSSAFSPGLSTQSAVPVSPHTPYPQAARPVPGRAPASPVKGKGAQGAANAPGAPIYPVLPPQPKVAPPIPIYKSLPSPNNQGCLWGLLQGVLSALLLLSHTPDISLKNPGYVYVGIAMGVFFYFVAGFFTTRKGGSALRGIWAGLWGGIASTIMFWFVYVIGLAVQLAKTASTPTVSLGQKFTRQLQLIASILFGQSSTHQGNNGALIYLVVGLVFAMAFGLLGGFAGTARYRAWMRRKGYS